MAKINTLTVEGDKKKGFIVTAMLETGTLLDIKEGLNIITQEEFDAEVESRRIDNEGWREQHTQLRQELERRHDASKAALDAKDADLKTAYERHKLVNADLEDANDEIHRLHAELGQLQQRLATRPAEPAAGLHREHQDVPLGRTVDMLAPLDALRPAATLDEPDKRRPERDPDAPARPPAMGQLSAVRPDPVKRDNDDDIMKTEWPQA